MNVTPDRPAPSRRQFQRLVFFGHGTNDLYWFILPVLLPMMLTRFDLEYAGGGTVLSVYLMVVALFSFTVGRLSDRWNRWRLIGAGFLLSAAGFVAASLMTTLGVFLGMLGVAAIGVSTFHPTMYGAIEETVQTKRGRFYGQFESWGGITITVMMIVTGFLLRSMAWTGVLRVVAIPGFVAGITFLLARAAPRPGLAAARIGDAHGLDHGEPGHEAVPRAVLIAFLISNMLRFVTVMGVIGFVPTFFVRIVGLGPDLAGYSTALFFAGGILGARLGGRLGDRFPPLRVMLVSLAVIGPLVALFSLANSPVLLGGILFLFGLAAMTCIPLQNLSLTRLGPDLGSGEVFGILIGVLTVTQALSPAAFGAVADAAGLRMTIRVFATPAMLSWLLLAAVTRVPAIRHLVSPRRADRIADRRAYRAV